MRIDITPRPEEHGDYKMKIKLPDGRRFTVTIGDKAIEGVRGA
jgi:hypothetical protein